MLARSFVVVVVVVVAGTLTIIDLLQRNLSILRQALLSLAAQHERLRLLRRCHGRMMLWIHHVGHFCRVERRVEASVENLTEFVDD